MNRVAQYADLALVMPAGAFGGWVVGSLLDRVWSTHWIYLLGIVLGMVGGFVHIVRTIGSGPMNEN